MVFFKDKNFNFDWKNFLKPDWKKILFTVVMTLLSYGSIYQIQAEYYEPSLFVKILQFPSLFCYPFWFQLPEMTVKLRGILCLWVSSIIIWYLLSCIVFAVYDKLRKKYKR